ncbi:hypothetical protein D6D12_07369 [Aureobasidium pullulans]|uniref:DUF6536 domain-containing protein n=1 Tax=Aureobasidium pullulans TaxID=5580 RepID=A0AB74JMF8_AURPU|nr:hypothetical protein D6D12_07369 [Aureobasidium pullulans]
MDHDLTEEMELAFMSPDIDLSHEHLLPPPVQSDNASQVNGVSAQLSIGEEPTDTDDDTPLLAAKHVGPQARFASITALSPWFPEADPDSDEAQTFRVKRSQRKFLLNGCAGLAAFTFVINLGSLLYVHYDAEDKSIFSGDCDQSGKLNSILHVLINILSTCLLGASNVCMQLLVAPRRSQIDFAHKSYKWLDISIPSVHNFRTIAWKQKLLWLFFALTSLPLHFLYNSSIYGTVAVNTYVILVVTPGFINGARADARASEEQAKSRENITMYGLQDIPPHHYVETTLNEHNWRFNYSKPCRGENCDIYQTRMQQGAFGIRLDPVECLSAYTTSFGNQSDVILVSTYDLVSDTTVTEDLPLLFAAEEYRLLGPGVFWACSTTNSFDCRSPEKWKNDPNLVSNWNVYGYKIDYCLQSQHDNSDLCRVMYTAPILIIVCIMNLCKLVAIVMTRYLCLDQDDPAICTIGDAVASFLKRQDETTKNICLTDYSKITRDKQYWRGRPRIEWRPETKRWFYGATLRSSILVLSGGVAYLIASLFQINNTAGSASSFVHYGFGKINDYAHDNIQGFSDINLKFYSRVLFVNVWQFAISMLYIQYNALLTTILCNDECPKVKLHDFDAHEV